MMEPSTNMPNIASIVLPENIKISPHNHANSVHSLSEVVVFVSTLLYVLSAYKATT